MRWLHKVLGTVCAPLFLLWLISGGVMIFCSFPRLGDKDLPLQDTLATSVALLSGATLQAKLQPGEELTALSLTTHCGEPVWRVETSEGGGICGMRTRFLRRLRLRCQRLGMSSMRRALALRLSWRLIRYDT